MSAELNPDGLEIAASVAFACGCLRVAAERAAVPAWALATAVASGVIVTLVWALGPLYVLLDLMLLIGLLGRQGCEELRAVRRNALVISGTSFGVALASFGAWVLAVGQTHRGLELSPILPSLSEALHQITMVWDQSVGVFGWIDLAMPSTTYRVYLLAVLTLVMLGWRAGDRRDRIMLCALTVLAALFPVLLYQWLLRPPSDQGVQGRYVIPVLILVPLLAGDILDRRGAPLRPCVSRRVQALAICLFAFIDVDALVSLGRYASGASGPWFAHARWSPPLGWGAWLVLTAVGGLALTSVAISILVGGEAPLSPGLRRRGQAMKTQRANSIT